MKYNRQQLDTQKQLIPIRTNLKSTNKHFINSPSDIIRFSTSSKGPVSKFSDAKILSTVFSSDAFGSMTNIKLGTFPITLL